MDARCASLDRRIGGIVDDLRLVAVEVEIDAVATAPGDRAAIGDSETIQVTEAGDAATRAAGDRAAVRDCRGQRRFAILDQQDRNSVVKGKGGSVRVDLGGRRLIKKPKQSSEQRNRFKN